MPWRQQMRRGVIAELYAPGMPSSSRPTPRPPVSRGEDVQCEPSSSRYPSTTSVACGHAAVAARALLGEFRVLVREAQLGRAFTGDALATPDAGDRRAGVVHLTRELELVEQAGSRRSSATGHRLLVGRRLRRNDAALSASGIRPTARSSRDGNHLPAMVQIDEAGSAVGADHALRDRAVRHSAHAQRHGARSSAHGDSEPAEAAALAPTVFADQGGPAPPPGRAPRPPALRPLGRFCRSGLRSRPARTVRPLLHARRQCRGHGGRASARATREPCRAARRPG